MWGWIHALLLCRQNLCTLLKFGDHSDYITTSVYKMAGGWLCSFFAFLWTDRETAFCNLICPWHCPNISHFLSPLHPMFFLHHTDLSKQSQAANMGPSCKLRQPIRTYMYCFVLSKGSVNDIIIITIGFIH